VIQVLRGLASALLVGVATIFQPKREREQHWSIPPTWPVDDHAEDGAGEP
jgi:hypothetical protein